jgi:hypothetical protein
MKVGDRRPAVLALRLQGFPPDLIAHKLGIRPSVVITDLKYLLNTARAESAEKDEMRAMQKLQLEFLWAALQTAIKSGNVQGIKVALNILERQSKLFGLDANPKATLNVVSGPQDWDALLSPVPAGRTLGFEAPEPD